MKKQTLWLLVFLGLIGLVNFSLAETEPNNTLDTANPIELTVSMPGSLNTNAPADTFDYYKVAVPSDGLLQIGVVPTKDLNVEILLIDTDGLTQLAGKNETGNGGTESILYPNLRAGTYWAVVKIPDAVDPVIGDYNILALLNPVEEIDTEPNDIPSQAIEMPLKGTTTGHIGYHGSKFTDLRDYCKITLPKDGKLELTAYPDGTANISLGLYNTVQTQNIVWKAEKGKGESEKIVYPNLLAGTYYVLVYLEEGYGSYNLTSLFSPVDTEDTEPNDALNSAFAVDLTGNSSVDVPGRLGYNGNQVQDDNDYYKITIPAYGKITFNAKLIAGERFNVGYELWDSQKRYVDGVGNTGTIANLPAGAYFARMYRNDGYFTYTLTVTFEKQDEPAPFDKPASELAVNTTIPNIAIDDSNTEYWYRVTLPEDGQIVVNSKFVKDCRVYVQLYNSDGATLFAGAENHHYYTDEDRSFTVPNLRKETYLLRIARNGGTGYGSVTTIYTPTTKNDPEPNDEWTTAPLPVKSIFSGHIGYYGNGWQDRQDIYALPMPEDGAVSITVTGVPTLRIYATLYNFDGNSYSQVDQVHCYYNDVPQTMANNNINHIAAGKYYLAIGCAGGYGSYDVQIGFIPNRNIDNEMYGDDWSKPTEIALNQGYTGHIGYYRNQYTDTSDYYKVVLPEDGSFDLTLSTDPSARLYVYLYYDDFKTNVVDPSHFYYHGGQQTLGSSQLRAGTYYIQIWQNNGFGAYQFYTSYQPQTVKDNLNNELAPAAQTVQVGEIKMGAIGYTDLFYRDSADWYRVDITTAGRYHINFQGVPAERLYLTLYDQNMVSYTQKQDHRYYNSTLGGFDVDLAAQPYYIQIWRDNGFGHYIFNVGAIGEGISGNLTGKVSTKTGFPLAEIVVHILDRETKTDAAGAYNFDNMPLGTHTVSFISGTKYYPEYRDVNITYSKTNPTVLDVIMLDSNKTAPYEVENFFGIPSNQYVNFFWSPSVSPDVSDGGGYKLYINNFAPIDLGNILDYGSFTFQNGVSYTCRLTVYDKYGNESAGKTIVITPSGTSVNPTPVPTVPLQATPTNTQIPGAPTPTVTPTPIPGQPTSPVPTNTPIMIINTPTPTLKPEAINPVFTFEFDKGAIGECGWGDTMLGGFSGNPAGFSKPGFPLVDSIFPASKDKKGLMLTVKPALVKGNLDEVCFINCNTLIETRGLPVLIVAYLQAENAKNNASIYVGALKGDFAKGGVDGSISYHAPANSINFTLPKRICCLYQPDGGVQMITPFIQIAAKKDGGSTTIYIDRVEVYLLQQDQNIPVSLLTLDY